MTPDGQFFGPENSTEVFLDMAGVVVPVPGVSGGRGAFRDRPDCPAHGGALAAWVMVLSQPGVTPSQSFAVVARVSEAARLVASIEENIERHGHRDAYLAALDQMRMWVKGSRQ